MTNVNVAATAAVRPLSGAPSSLKSKSSDVARRILHSGHSFHSKIQTLDFDDDADAYEPSSSIEIFVDPIALAHSFTYSNTGQVQASVRRIVGGTFGVQFICTNFGGGTLARRRQYRRVRGNLQRQIGLYCSRLTIIASHCRAQAN